MFDGDIASAFEAIARRAAEANPPEQGDYEVGGLLYCGKCGTPKQCFVNNPFKAGRVDVRSCMCKCRVEEMKARDEAAKQAENARRIRDMRRIGFPDEKMREWTFDHDDGANEKVMTAMRRYVENFPEMLDKGKGLLLYGDVDTGKTFAAACVVNALIDNGQPCLLTNFTRISNTLMGMFDGKQAYIDGFNRFALLAIDDLRTERNTEYMGEIVYDIINNRYMAGLPLIVTTNLTGAQLKNPSDIRDQRIYSRLLGMCIPVEVNGVHRRRKKLADEYKGYADMLGL